MGGSTPHGDQERTCRKSQRMDQEPAPRSRWLLVDTKRSRAAKPGNWPPTASY